MQDAGVIQPSSRELERLIRIDVAASSFVVACEECWRHRSEHPDDPVSAAQWMGTRDELDDRREEALVALVSAVHRG